MDSSPTNHPLEVGASHSAILSLSCFPHSVFYTQEIQLIFVALVPIYGPMTTIFISQPSASLLCSRPSHPMPAPDTSMCVSHGHLKHNDSNLSSCTSIPISVCAICVNGTSTHPAVHAGDSNPSLFSSSTSNPSQRPPDILPKGIWFLSTSLSLCYHHPSPNH